MVAVSQKIALISRETKEHLSLLLFRTDFEYILAQSDMV